MAKAKKSSKKVPPERDGAAWAAKVKENRYGEFTLADLQKFAALLDSFSASVKGKIKAMEDAGLESLTGVYGATQPARVEKELRSFVGNVGRALEKQRP